MSAETLEHLTRLVEGVEALLDPYEQGTELDYDKLHCKCGRKSCFNMKDFNNLLVKVWDARAYVNRMKGEIKFIRKLIGCRRPDCDN